MRISLLERSCWRRRKRFDAHSNIIMTVHKTAMLKRNIENSVIVAALFLVVVVALATTALVGLITSVVDAVLLSRGVVMFSMKMWGLRVGWRAVVVLYTSGVHVVEVD